MWKSIITCHLLFCKKSCVCNITLKSIQASYLKKEEEEVNSSFQCNITNQEQFSTQSERVDKNYEDNNFLCVCLCYDKDKYMILWQILYILTCHRFIIAQWECRCEPHDVLINFQALGIGEAIKYRVSGVLLWAPGT